MKKAYVIVPAGLAAVYIGWRWYRAKQDAADAGPAQSDGTYTTTDLTDAGLATTGGTTNVTGNTGSQVTDATNPNSIDSNAEWTQKAVELLGNAGYDSQTVYAALGEFLARRSLDKSEASIARAAVAAVGQPPVGGPYPINEAAATGTTTLTAPKNVHATAVTSTSVTLAFDPVTGAGYYRAYRSGASTNVGSTDAGNHSIVVSGLQPNTTYQFQVAADTTLGKPGPKSSAVTVKTAAVKLSRPSTPKASAITRTSFRATVPKVNGATYYRWFLNGHQVAPTDANYHDFTGLKPNTTYSVAVAADNTSQSPGPTSSAARVKTKR